MQADYQIFKQKYQPQTQKIKSNNPFMQDLFGVKPKKSKERKREKVSSKHHKKKNQRKHRHHSKGKENIKTKKKRANRSKMENKKKKIKQTLNRRNSYESGSINYKKILNYMRDKQRPFNAVQIVQNLHKEISRKKVDKILEKLVNEKKVILKMFKKTKIFMYNQ